MESVAAMTGRRQLKVLLAEPRGYCAGVERALEIVHLALKRWGPPVYVRHDIVHNLRVVAKLRSKGVVFVDELDECPDDRPVIFSAHGVAASVKEEAERRNLLTVDATCPLVAKVHAAARWHSRQGRQIVMVGQKGHAETIGTMGQVAEGEMLLVQSTEDIGKLAPRDEGKLAYTTQTTLSVDDVAETVDALRRRFPKIAEPKTDDICYATTNRQNAVKALARQVDVLFVIGAPHSSNTRHLVETGRRAGCGCVLLLQGAGDLNWNVLEGARRLGITASASSPEYIVEEMLEAIRERFELSVETVSAAVEDVKFNVPRILQRQGTDLNKSSP